MVSKQWWEVSDGVETWDMRWSSGDSELRQMEYCGNCCRIRLSGQAKESLSGNVACSSGVETQQVFGNVPTWMRCARLAHSQPLTAGPCRCSHLAAGFLLPVTTDRVRLGRSCTDMDPTVSRDWFDLQVYRETHTSKKGVFNEGWRTPLRTFILTCRGSKGDLK